MRTKMKKILYVILSTVLVFTLISANLGTIKVSAEGANPKVNNVTEDNNIKVNLFDYSLYDKDGKNIEDSLYSNGEYSNIPGINFDRSLKFMSSTDDVPDSDEYKYNKWTGTNGAPRSDIVKKQLGDDGYPQLNVGKGESLKYLFDPDTPIVGKSIHKDVKTENFFSFDSNTKRYSFDSNKKYGYYDSERNRLIAQDYNEEDVKNLKAFYPFNSQKSLKDKTINEYNYGNGLAANDANHYFGMTMETDFIMPKNGQVNGKDMTFEFTGDDDVWVFIDNKLVLDLGGIHNVIYGSINFNTGEVKVKGNGDSSSYSSSYNMYKSIFNKDSDFKNYSSHNIKFYYLERGNNASNCSLNFNLPTIPASSVVVAKEVVDATGKYVGISDIEYEFEIKKNDTTLKETAYSLYKNQTLIKADCKTDSNGKFKLKNDEYAVFPGYLDNQTYEVTETGVYLKDGYEVSTSFGEVTWKDDDGNISPGFTTGPINVWKNRSVKFTNKIKNTASLKMTKLIESSSEDLLADQEYQFKVKLNGLEFNGNYYKNGTPLQTNNGIISLKKDDSISIDGLPYGTTFEIEEALLEDTAYVPSYSISSTTKDKVENLSTDKKISGKIIDGKSVEVNVENKINSNRNRSITFEKKWDDNNSNDRPDSITVQLYKNGKVEGKEIKITGENNWQHIFENLEYYSINEDGQYIENVYTVMETKIGDEEVKDNMTSKYIVTVGKLTNNTITVTNTRKVDLKIEKKINKVDLTNGDPIFTFKITCPDDSVMYKSIRFTNENKLEKEITIKDLPIGKYTVEELPTIRYEQCDDKFESIVKDAKSITLTSTGENKVTFYNKLIYDDNFSHTDMVENKFTIEGGKVTITPRYSDSRDESSIGGN